MVAIRAHFDGEKIVIPKKFQGSPPRDVLVIIEDSFPLKEEKKAWLKAQETSFQKVWDNEEDAVYDSL